MGASFQNRNKSRLEQHIYVSTCDDGDCFELYLEVQNVFAAIVKPEIKLKESKSKKNIQSQIFGLSLPRMFSTQMLS